MKNVKVHTLLVLATLALIVATVSFAARSSRGQTPLPESPTTVKPAIRITERRPETSGINPVFVAAAEQNAILRDELIWTFGGKSQRGWYLYDLLIDQTIKPKNGVVSSEFAASLAEWQKKARLNPNGMLDLESLMAMIAQWQSSRLKNKTYAIPDQLVTVPPSDFYDPQRVIELRQVERQTYEAYKKMVSAAMSDSTSGLGKDGAAERYFKIISAFRSRDYQEKLRRESPNAGSAGLAVNSPHFTGKALDIYVGGDPVDTRDANRAIQVKSPAYKWLVRNAERFGFRPYFYEPWHWEYVR